MSENNTPPPHPPDDRTPKVPIRYRFYCKICGNEFAAGKLHATTCSATCRVALNKLKRNNMYIEVEEQLTPEQRELAIRKVAHAQNKVADIGRDDDPNPVHKIMRIGRGKIDDKPNLENFDQNALAAGDGTQVPEPEKAAATPTPTPPPAAPEDSERRESTPAPKTAPRKKKRHPKKKK